MVIRSITIEDDKVFFKLSDNDTSSTMLERVSLDLTAGTKPHILLSVIESRIREFNSGNFSINSLR